MYVQHTASLDYISFSGRHYKCDMRMRLHAGLIQGKMTKRSIEAEDEYVSTECARWVRCECTGVSVLCVYYVWCRCVLGVSVQV